MNNYNTLSPNDSETLIDHCIMCGEQKDDLLDHECKDCRHNQDEQQLIEICESNREQIERGKHGN